MRFAAALIVFLGLAAAGAAEGETLDLARTAEGTVYFHRSGADLIRHDNDILDCLRTQVAGKIPPGGIEPQADRLPLISVLADSFNRPSVENCMVFHGWELMRLSAAQADQTKGQETAELRTRLTDWVGSAAPPGEVLRRWGNEAFLGSTIRANSSALIGKGRNLSLLALPDAVKSRSMAAFMNGVRGPAPLRGAPRLNGRKLAGSPPENAVIVVRIRNPSLNKGYGVIFERVGEGAGVTGPAPTMAVTSSSGLRAGRDGETFAFSVAPGQWRLAAITSGVSGLDLCLGGPGFRLAAGDAIYAGAFDMAAPTLGPDFDLEAVRKDLMDWPEGLARLRPAAYENGLTGPCRDRNIYALTLPGAPAAAPPPCAFEIKEMGGSATVQVTAV